MSDDWRLIVMRDGRSVEFVSCEWEPDDGTEPPGMIRVRVHYLLDGEAGSRVVLMTSKDFEDDSDGDKFVAIDPDIYRLPPEGKGE